MAQIIKTVSVSKDEDEFIVKNNISPTRLLREKVREMMNFQNKDEQVIIELERKIKIHTEMSADYRKFIDKEGLTDKYLKECDDVCRQKASV